MGGKLGRRDRRLLRRRRRRGAAGPPAGGHRPDPRGRPGRRAGAARHHGGADLDPRPAAPAARAAVHGRARRPRRPGRSGLLSPAGLARAGQEPGLPATRGTGTCRWPGTWRAGSATKSWTGWWTRSSAVSTPAGPTSCPSRPPCPAWPGVPGPRRWPRRRDRCCRRARRHAGAAALHRARRCSPPSPAGSGRCPRRSPSASGAAVRTGATVRGLARTADGWRLTVGSSARRGAAGRRCGDPGRSRPARQPAAGRRPAGPAAAAALGEIGYASMAIVTLAYPQRGVSPACRGPVATWCPQWTGARSRR